MELVGHTLGPYQVLEKIGHGGMAEVYKAFHSALNRFVAIKLLGQSLGADPNFAKRFQREAQAITVLDHPNIVQIFDFGVVPAEPEGDNIHYLVMEYIDGKDLRAEMAGRSSGGEPFTPNEILDIMGQVAEALDYAHQRGVVHRDIKPGNILVTDDGRVVLTDFGLAMLRDRPSQATMGKSFGTPEYIAPEQAIDSRAASPQSDIYSLGVVLYEMVTGRLPFEDESPLSLALKHINEDPIPPQRYAPDLPKAVESVILQVLAKEPSDRFPTARAMVDALKHAWSGPILLPIGAVSRPARSLRGLLQALSRRMTSFSGQQKGLLAVGLLVILLLIGLGGRFFLGWGGDSSAMGIVTDTVTATPTALSTFTVTPTSSATPFSTATATASPSHTPTKVLSPSNTPTSTSTLTPTTKPTQAPASTPSPAPTDTPSPVPPPSPPTITPEGAEDLYNRILFKTDRSGAVQVYSMNPDGSDQRPIQNALIYNELAPLEALSPDGKQQIVVRTEGNAELWLVSLDGSESEWRITYTEAFDYDPVWSPVGDLIAFVSEQTGNGDIYISTPLGFDMQRITINQDPVDKHPSWSPDGRYLAFWSDANFHLRQIYVYDILTGETHIVGGGPFNDWDPLWVK
jgi:serine/threonine protein kinase